MEENRAGADLPGQYLRFRSLSHGQIERIVGTPSAGYTSAFYGDAELKKRFIERADEHRRADNIVRGTYWSHSHNEEGFHGCAVGCLSHAGEDAHVVLARLTNVPQAIYQLTDYLFESQSVGFDHTLLPRDVMEAIAVGSDQSHTHYRILARFLETGHGVGGIHPADRAKLVKMLRDPDISQANKLAAVRELGYQNWTWQSIDVSFWQLYTRHMDYTVVRKIMLEELAAAPVPVVEVPEEQMLMAEFMKDFVPVTGRTMGELEELVPELVEAMETVTV